MRNKLKIVVLIIACVELAFAVLALFSSLSDIQTLIAVIIGGCAAVIPLFCIVLLLEKQEELDIRVAYLENELIRNDIKENPVTCTEIPEAQKGRKAIVEWSCPKCGTVNKANTTNCEHCGAAY